MPDALIEAINNRKRWVESELKDILTEQSALLKEYSKLKEELDEINTELKNLENPT